MSLDDSRVVRFQSVRPAPLEPFPQRSCCSLRNMLSDNVSLDHVQIAAPPWTSVGSAAHVLDAALSDTRIGMSHVQGGLIIL